MKYYIIPVTIFNQNCSIICCKYTKEAVLVDPGGDSKKIKNTLLCLNDFKIKAIWLTHGHIDHVGSAKELSLFYKIPIFGPQIKEKKLLLNLSKQCRVFNFNIIKSFIPDRWLVDGDVLNVGILSFTVLHCPGHSPGHVIFWNKKKNLF